jgi:DNA polymerase II small subunit/DNA polymerase delta subunit B
MPKLNKRKRLIDSARTVKKMKKNSSEPLPLIGTSIPMRTFEKENDTPIPLSNKALELKQKLIKKINMLPEKQILACSTLLEIMVYPDGIHKGEIISPYLQKRALDLVLSNRGKQNSSAAGIQNKIKLLKSENERLTKKIESTTSKKKILAIKLKKQEQNKDLYISRMRSLVARNDLNIIYLLNKFSLKRKRLSKRFEKIFFSNKSRNFKSL